MIYGIDVSHYQGASFDFARARREGFEFAILKASEGATYVDPRFSSNIQRARAAGLLVAAYHYVRSGSSAASQVALIQRLVPRDCPIILDVEAGGGGVGLTRDLNARLNAAGYRTPLLYLPKWYWKQIGRPNLAGLPPLWYSRYANNQGGYASQIWERSAGWFNQFWAGYGGLHVEILQYSDKATVAGHTPVDVNTYRGTREQLAALLGGQGNQEVDMATVNELFELVRRYSGGDSAFGYTIPRSPDRVRTFAAAIPPRNGRVTGNQGEVFVSLVAGEKVEIREIYAVEDWVQDGVPGKRYGLQGAYTLVANDRQSFPVPAACTQVCVVYKSDCDLSLSVEVDSKWK